MKTPPENLNGIWSSLLIEELSRNGVNFFSLASGARSSPLVAAVAAASDVRHSVHIDERGAAYCALGYAKATGQPAVCITTSGTAVANCYPAVVEASRDHIPLLVLSADRPPELRDTGANQTVDQVKIFGDYVRWFFDLPCPAPDVPPEFLLTTVDEAIARTRGPSAGPVHINCMFREPLLSPADSPDAVAYTEHLSSWQQGAGPYTTHDTPLTTLSAGGESELHDILEQADAGLLVVGTLHNEVEKRAVAEFARILDWPVFADVTSGLQGRSDIGVIAGHDALLSGQDVALQRKPDTVLRIGGALVSKRILQYLDATKPAHFITVQSVEGRIDPHHGVTRSIRGDIATFCLRAGNVRTRCSSVWREAWQGYAMRASEVVGGRLDAEDQLNEPGIARHLSRSIRPEDGFVVGCSMPVRDVDVFGELGVGCFNVTANRGASGIDGTLATACGYAAGLRRPVTVLLGDLSLLHDVSSLGMVKNSPYPIRIVVINNDGGGIYSFLPLSSATDIFEDFFGTPHGMNFKPLAETYGLSYNAPASMDDFRSVLNESAEITGSVLIEVITRRDENHALHRELLQLIHEVPTVS